MTETLVSLTGGFNEYNGETFLNNINVELKAGDVLGIIGPSGCGKSSLLRCMTMLQNLSHGNLTYGGIKVVTDNGEGAVYANSATRKQAHKHFGMVFQDYNLFPHFSVMRNICDPAIHVQKRKRPEVEAEAGKLIAKLGLEGLEKAVPCDLSGGQQQRVAIARALALNPNVLYFDEPTSALDPELTHEVEKVILDLQKTGIAMAVVTHSMSFAEKVANKIAFMDKGAIVEFGDAEQVLNNPKHERTRKFLSSLES